MNERDALLAHPRGRMTDVEAREGEQETGPREPCCTRVLKWFRDPLNLLKVFFLVVIVLVIVLAVVYRETTVQIAEDYFTWMQANEVAGSFALLGIYVLATVLFFPGSIVSLGCGYIYAQLYSLAAGTAVASLVVFVGASIGSILAFLLGRWVFKGCVDSCTKKFPVFKVINEVIAERGIMVGFLLRLSPLIPFNALNYVFGLTPVSLKDYTIALVGMIPGTVVFCFLGASIKGIAEIATTGLSSGNTGILVAVIVGSVFSVLAIILVGWYARKKWKEVTAGREDEAEMAADEPDLPAESS